MPLDTDASGVGWGAVLDCWAEHRGYHWLNRIRLHVSCQELVSVTNALLSFRHLIHAGTTLRLLTDSIVALGVMHVGLSRSLVLIAKMQGLSVLFQDMGVMLQVEHVSSTLKEWPGRLYRVQDSTDWNLRSFTFQHLDAEYGPHSRDLFASTGNTRTSDFYVRWLCTGALDTTSLAHSWENENTWSKSPFHLLGAVLHKIVTSHATVTPIAPVWQAPPCLPRAADSLRGLPCGLHERFQVHTSAHAFLVDSGVPLRENNARRNDAQRCALLKHGVVGPLVDDLHIPEAAARLLLKGYRPNTERSYMSKCQEILIYCSEDNSEPMREFVPSIITLMLYELERGAFAPPSLSKTLSAVVSLDRRARLEHPTKDTLVLLAVFGFRSYALEHGGGELELQRMPLPASEILRAYQQGLSTHKD